jgi:hypothetical protein
MGHWLAELSVSTCHNALETSRWVPNICRANFNESLLNKECTPFLKLDTPPHDNRDCLRRHV